MCREPCKSSPDPRGSPCAKSRCSADVSEVTASRALRNPELVSERLRERVVAAARELAYIPNQLASALASSRTGRVAVIVPSLTNGVFDDYLRAAHDVFTPAGFQVVILNSNYVPGFEEKAIETALGQFPEAIVLAGIDQTASRPPAAEPGRHSRRSDDGDRRRSDRHQHRPVALRGGPRGGATIVRTWPSSVAHIASPLDSRARERVRGYLEGGSGISTPSPSWRPTSKPSNVAVGCSLLVEILQEAPATTAIFCGNDNLALGAIFECQRRGDPRSRRHIDYRVQRSRIRRSAFPSLSTIATPRYEMARRAAEIILEITRGSGKRPRRRCVDLGFQVVERESTRRMSGATSGSAFSL